MILIVDDKPENIYSLKILLESRKLSVDTALSGEEALKKILVNNYSLIILDVQMPGMDGFEVAESLSGLKKSQNIPIIFLSAVNTNKQFIIKGYESGGIDYLTKPVDSDILLLKVNTFTKLYEQTKELNEIQAVLREEIEIRKKVQTELKQKIEQLHSTLEALPLIAFTSDLYGNIDFVNGHEDHCHCLVSLGVDQTIKMIMQLIKGEAAFWFNQQHFVKHKLEWQDEYFAVSVSESQIETVRNYIKNQEEHHKHKTFQQEYDEFMIKYGFEKFKD